MKREKVLVTGAAGFIGSNICTRLISQGYEVAALDNVSTGRIENIAHLMDNPSFFFKNGDINDLDTVKGIVKGCDYVLHQAAIPSVPRSVADPITSNKANIDGTLNVLVAARDAGVKKLVFASSSSVYGDSVQLPKHEGMEYNPLSPYALNKLTGELYCKIFTDLYGLKTSCLRYFNVYGPRQNPHSEYAAVIPKFIDSVMRDESPTIFGDGQQSRDFTFVEDVVDANILAMKSPSVGNFNIAGGKRVTLIELVSMINTIVGKDVPPIFSDERAGDIKHSLADISKARDSFGYEPKFTLEMGLRRTVEWFTN